MLTIVEEPRVSVAIDDAKQRWHRAPDARALDDVDPAVVGFADVHGGRGHGSSPLIGRKVSTEFIVQACPKTMQVSGLITGANP